MISANSTQAMFIGLTLRLGLALSNPLVLELLSPYITDVQYGQSLLLKFQPKIICFE